MKLYETEAAARAALNEVIPIMSSDTASPIARLDAYQQAITAEYSMDVLSEYQQKSADPDFWQTQHAAASQLREHLARAIAAADKAAGEAARIARRQVMEARFADVPADVREAMAVSLDEDGEWIFDAEF